MITFHIDKTKIPTDTSLQHAFSSYTTIYETTYAKAQREAAKDVKKLARKHARERKLNHLYERQVQATVTTNTDTGVVKYFLDIDYIGWP